MLLRAPKIEFWRSTFGAGAEWFEDIANDDESKRNSDQHLTHARPTLFASCLFPFARHAFPSR